MFGMKKIIDLVVAVINVEAYPFFGFLRTDMSPWGYRNECFLVVPPDSKKAKLGSSDQKASPSSAKNAGVVLVPCCSSKYVPAAISRGVDIVEVPSWHLLQQMSSQWRSQKLLQGLVSHELTACLSDFDLFLTLISMT